jgi:outer membrane protein TolC
MDIDLQVLWEFQSLGFGNKARVGERRAEHQAATLELFRTQDRIAAEVSIAFAQAKAASERMTAAEPSLKEARELVEKSLQGMGQTKRMGDSLVLIVRPQEVVAAVQLFALANADFYSAVGDYNRAQFRLYRALGHPATGLVGMLAPELNIQGAVSPLSANKPMIYPQNSIQAKTPEITRRRTICP